MLVESRTKWPAAEPKSAMWHRECRANNITQRFESLTWFFSPRGCLPTDEPGLPECIFWPVFFLPRHHVLCLLCLQAVPPRPTLRLTLLLSAASFGRSAFFPGPCRCHGSRCHAVPVLCARCCRIQTCRKSADFAANAAAKEAGRTDADVSINSCPWPR